MQHCCYSEVQRGLKARRQCLLAKTVWLMTRVRTKSARYTLAPRHLSIRMSGHQSSQFMALLNCVTVWHMPHGIVLRAIIRSNNNRHLLFKQPSSHHSHTTSCASLSLASSSHNSHTLTSLFTLNIFMP